MFARTMRVLHINICVFLVAFSVIHAQQSSGSIRPFMSGGIGARAPAEITPVSAKSGKFLDHAEKGKDANSKMFMDLMKEHFDLSMDYLLTSKQFASQYVQRPGLAKYMSEASSRQWEEGMDILKKFLQRGGSISDVNFKPAFKIEGKPELSGTDTEGYIQTMKSMLEDSKELAMDMNQLHHLAGKITDRGGDAEIAHYFDDKLEKEAEITRELAGHINTLQKMSTLGVAMHIFDSDL
ncbi:ferritin light chain-like isoform X3 [Macrobrachium rosenbergii]|uniref:ferritin light chain-like isoform X3 n=1 Tax=Macrobrachium rosenbergii TaxID=79674 RepID=UPI0034D5A086